MSEPNIDKIMKALAKYGIYTKEELDEAIKNMKPLNITCMVSPVKGDKRLTKETNRSNN